MLCVDCYIEDDKEVEALVIQAGYSLCKKHLTRFIVLTHNQITRSSDICAEYLNRTEVEPN